MKRPIVEYRTVTVLPTDPPEEPEIQQQVMVTWDKIKNCSIVSDGDWMSIVYTADTRKELVQFLAGLSKALSS